MFIGSQSAGLDKELVHAHQSHNVATGHILNRLNVAAHHQNGSRGEKEGEWRGREGEERERERERESSEVRGKL